MRPLVFVINIRSYQVFSEIPVFFVFLCLLMFNGYIVSKMLLFSSRLKILVSPRFSVAFVVMLGFVIFILISCIESVLNVYQTSMGNALGYS